MNYPLYCLLERKVAHFCHAEVLPMLLSRLIKVPSPSVFPFLPQVSTYLLPPLGPAYPLYCLLERMVVHFYHEDDWATLFSCFAHGTQPHLYFLFSSGQSLPPFLILVNLVHPLFSSLEMVSRNFHHEEVCSLSYSCLTHSLGKFPPSLVLMAFVNHPLFCFLGKEDRMFTPWEG